MLVYNAHSRPLSTRLLGGLCGMLLVVGIQREVRSQTPPWKTYTDTLHGYQFNYPPDYEIQDSGWNFSLQRRDAGTESEFYIEDLSREGSYLLLVIDTWPNRRGVAPDVLRSIVSTIRRVEP